MACLLQFPKVVSRVACLLPIAKAVSHVACLLQLPKKVSYVACLLQIAKDVSHVACLLQIPKHLSPYPLWPVSLQRFARQWGGASSSSRTGRPLVPIVSCLLAYSQGPM